MGAIGDGQSTDEYTVSICAKDASGPYHYGLKKEISPVWLKKMGLTINSIFIHSMVQMLQQQCDQAMILFMG